METDERAVVETIVLAIEIDGPGRAPALFDDFSTLEGDRRLSERLDHILSDAVCTCRRRVKGSLQDLFAEPPGQGAKPSSHVCEIIPFPKRWVRFRASSPDSTRA